MGICQQFPPNRFLKVAYIVRFVSSRLVPIVRNPEEKKKRVIMMMMMMIIIVIVMMMIMMFLGFLFTYGMIE